MMKLVPIASDELMAKPRPIYLSSTKSTMMSLSDCITNAEETEKSKKKKKKKKEKKKKKTKNLRCKRM